MASEVLWRGTGALTEQAGSPEWDFGERVSAVLTFRGMFDLARYSAPPRGALGSGEFAGLRVSNSHVTRERGGIGLLKITYEGVLEDETQVPPDRISIQSGQQEFSIDVHPKFSSLTKTELKGCHSYVDASNDIEANEFAYLLSFTEASALIERLIRGQDHFVLFPPVYEWTTYYVSQPDVDPGGYIEVPTGPAVPPVGYDWLRAGDSVEWENGFWALTRRWVSSFQWDSYLYPVEA